MIKNNLLKRLTFLLGFIIVGISCNNNQKIIDKNKLVNISYKLNLPDSIQVGDTINGTIIYKSDFDTIKRNLIEHYSFMVLDSISDAKEGELYRYPNHC